LEGLDLILVETKVNVRENGYRSKCRYWIDPARGFTIVRRQTFEPLPDGIGWGLHHQMDCREFAEVVPSVWLPMVVEESLNLVKASPPYTSSRESIRVSEWRVNEDLAADTFQPDWDPGPDQRS